MDQREMVLTKPVTAKEAQLAVGVEPIDELLAELEATQEEWARGASLYGPGGVFDAQRVAFLAVLALEHREVKQEGAKPLSDQHVKERAHADRRYTSWLRRQTAQRTDWLTLDAKRDAIIMRVNRGQGLLRVA